MKFKYPSTPHLPWSLGAKDDDDSVLTSVNHFEGKHVIVTVKMDGENTSLYKDYFHTRSLNSRSHVSQDWVKNFHAQFKYKIPEGWRICGESLYAHHSIFYNKLESYFQVFNIWNEKLCLSWEETKKFCEELNLIMVPILYEGIWNENLIRTFFADKFGEDEMEGYVVRVSSSFNYDNFYLNYAKFVRAGHVKTDSHWKNKPMILNMLKHESTKERLV